MSVTLKARLLWVLPVAVIASWFAVRTLAASTIVKAPEPPALVMAAEIATPLPRVELKDAALARLITRLAAHIQRK